MTAKNLLIGCGIALFVFVIAIFGWGLYIYHRISPALRAAMQPPAALTHPGVAKGAGFLSKTEFVADSMLGNVTDIEPGKLDPAPGVRIGIAGRGGAVFVDERGSVKNSVHFSTSLRHLDIGIVPVHGTDKCEFMNRGLWSSSPGLLDHSGNVLWEYKALFAADGMAAGDVNGDGHVEFAIGNNGAGGLDLVNDRGGKLWNKPDGNVWHVEIADLQGNGRLEIIHSNAAGEIKVRDASGNVISESRATVYCSNFTLCKWPTRNSRPLVLVASKGIIWLLSPSGATVSRLDAPDCPDQGDAKAALVRLKGGDAEYLAVLVTFKMFGRSLLYVYDPAGKLVYQEILRGINASIAAMPLDKSGAESLLIGGEGHVMRYGLPKQRSN